MTTINNSDMKLIKDSIVNLHALISKYDTYDFNNVSRKLLSEAINNIQTDSIYFVEERINDLPLEALTLCANEGIAPDNGVFEMNGITMIVCSLVESSENLKLTLGIPASVPIV